MSRGAEAKISSDRRYLRNFIELGSNEEETWNVRNKLKPFSILQCAFLTLLTAWYICTKYTSKFLSSFTTKASNDIWLGFFWGSICKIFKFYSFIFIFNKSSDLCYSLPGVSTVFIHCLKFGWELMALVLLRVFYYI